MSDTLKPCPFCDNGSHKPKNSSEVKTVVKNMSYCPWCGTKSAWYGTKKEAIDAWNTRPIESALQKRIAELETGIAELESFVAMRDELDYMLERYGKSLDPMTKGAEAIRDWMRENVIKPKARRCRAGQGTGG